MLGQIRSWCFYWKALFYLLANKTKVLSNVKRRQEFINDLLFLFISQQHMLRYEFDLIMIERMPEIIIANIHEQVMTLPFLPSWLLPLAVLSVFFPLMVFFEMQPKSSETQQWVPFKSDCFLVSSDLLSVQKPLLMYVLGRLDTSQPLLCSRKWVSLTGEEMDAHLLCGNFLLLS